jgi:site-specific DNA-methyltransferase (adenine-specific)
MIKKSNIFKSSDGKIVMHNDNVTDLYDKWKTPIIIISDGPYGIGGFPGDPHISDELDKWYEIHIKEWSKKATPQTSLWFWNTELGWANVHPILQKYGWKFVNCHIWNKGISHVAGKTNSRTLRKLPIVTEVVVQYVKEPEFKINDDNLSMKEWLRYEWLRTGLSLSKTNEAAGVKNAATRKYFTKCHLWYMPPPEVFDKISKYANKYGKQSSKPYFSIDGKNPLEKEEWEKMRTKFKCPIGITNVWDLPPLNGNERIKIGSKSFHMNQKPLKFIELIISISSDENDIIWDPFGGLGTSAIAARKLNRRCFLAEIDSKVFQKAVERYNKEFGDKS